MLANLSFTPLAVVTMALAMGAENAIFVEDGDVRIGLTYMTGALVNVGQRLAQVATGGDRFSWIPFLFQWAALVAGAVGGAATYRSIGLDGLWIAAFAASLLTIAAIRLRPS
jgi:uncharacterized membrane protein YoaK (UPF0700 family)